MSILVKINELLKPKLTPAQRLQKKTDNTVAAAIKRVTQGGSKDPLDLKIKKQADVDAKRAIQKMKQLPKETPTKKTGKVVEQDAEPVAPPGADPAAAGAPVAPDPAAAAPEAPAPMTTEGETFYVNLARKSLFVDLDNMSLTDAEREMITQDVQPENAKEVAKVLRKIVVDYGLSENFDSKINSLIEDLKKNDRVVVLVPGSFKPPHKGHYEMVKQYSQMYPGGQVHVLISAPSAKSERRTKDGRLITPAAAKQIFELYIQPLNNVTVSVSEFPSPVTSAYESLKELSPGTTVVLGASRKDDDWKRWSHAQPWAEKEGLGLDIIDPAQSAVDITLNAEGQPYSASNIRANFDDFEKIRADIPDHVNPEAIKQIFASL